MKNLPLHDFSQNQIWIAVVMLATELTAWMQMLALTGTEARVWEPKRLRLRLFHRRPNRPTVPPAWLNTDPGHFFNTNAAG